MGMGCGRLARIVAGVAASLLLVVAVPQVAEAETGFRIGDRHVMDPSGMAADPERERYWAVAGGYGQVRAWAMDAEGVPLGPAAAQNQAQSVQAVAELNGNLYLGDVGGVRSTVTIWRLRGPVPTTTVREAGAYRLSYPDGSHSSKAMMVDSRRRVFVVTVGEPGAIYWTPKRPSLEETTQLEKLASAPNNVVDAVMLPGVGAVMRSYTELYFLDSEWNVVSTEPIPDQPQGGALALSLDGRSVVAAAGSDGATQVFPIPEKLIPERPEKQQPSETEMEPGDEEQGLGGPTVIPQTGTAVTVVAAMGVAVLAGLVVLVRR